MRVTHAEDALPFNGRTRRYKQYPAGSIPASDEESLVWDYLKWAEGEVTAARAAIADLWGTLCPDAGPEDYAGLAKRAADLVTENRRLKDELVKMRSGPQQQEPDKAQASAPKVGRR